MGLLTIENHAGQPEQHLGRQITPFAQTWWLRPPFSAPQAPGVKLIGGVSWSRPVSVLVTEADGSETVLPVRDPTRWIVCGLYTACAVVALMMGILSIRSRRSVGNG
jgi:hypothetical protein